MNEFFSWEALTTVAGASAATAVITQFVKKSFAKIPTQIVSYAIALAVLLIGSAAIGAAQDWTYWAIIPFNAVVVSLGSNGAFAAIQRIEAAYKRGNQLF